MTGIASARHWLQATDAGPVRRHIALPRRCLDAASELLADSGIRLDLRDQRHARELTAMEFAGTLRRDQDAAVAAMPRRNDGVLCEPTAFERTVTAAAI